MPPRSGSTCAQRQATTALADGQLEADERERAEEHLLECEPCRLHFRQQTVERYPKIRNCKIIRELGRGGFGVVYKALHHGKKRYEALKVLFSRTPQRAAYFENEVRLVANLRHTNIATLYEARVTAAPLYYSMEFVAGEHLDDYLRSHDVSLEERLELLKTVAEAMEYAHAQGVVHRDLKPQNILIDGQGQPRIVDFGIAKKLVPNAAEAPGDDDEPHSPEGAMGTFGYIAPEQLSGVEADSRADVYSLGALLFHIITGQPARFAPHVERLTEILHEGEVSRADDLAAIIACCVRPDPQQRYKTCAALVRDLDNYLTGLPVRARPDTTPGYHARRIATFVLRWHPLPVQFAAVAVVAVVLSALLGFAQVRWITSAGQLSGATLIAFAPSTMDAINAGRCGADLPGLEPANRPSYRLLYGRLMEKLAVSQPSVVVWDYYFPRCAPQYDPAFIRGVKALDCPVVVGFEGFDHNGEPLLCADIRAAIHSWGSLTGISPYTLEREVVIPVAMQQGFNPPVPGLALVGQAAAVHPDCDLRIGVGADYIERRYRKRTDTAGEKRWLDETQRIPIFKTDKGSDAHPFLAPKLNAILARFPQAGLHEWASRAIPLEDVLAADTEQCRRWFEGRPVLIGRMIAPLDHYPLQSGQYVFGCQIQALLIELLMAETGVRPLTRGWLALIVGGWCLVALLIVNLIPVPSGWRIRRPGLALAAGGVAGLAAALVLVLITSDPLAGQVIVGGSAVLTAGCAACLVRLVHMRQSRPTPGPTWPANGSTLSTTVLASSLSSNIERGRTTPSPESRGRCD